MKAISFSPFSGGVSTQSTLTSSPSIPRLNDTIVVANRSLAPNQKFNFTATAASPSQARPSSSPNISKLSSPSKPTKTGANTSRMKGTAATNPFPSETTQSDEDLISPFSQALHNAKDADSEDGNDSNNSNEDENEDEHDEERKIVI